MKGKNTFTSSQIRVIKELIQEKVDALPDKQKSIRAKIRSLGFYYSDFSMQKGGYTVIDFDNLIRSGKVKISDESNILSKALLTSHTKSVTKAKETNLVSNSSNLLFNLEQFKKNRFDPHTDNENIISNSPGNYIICLKKGAKLPNTHIIPVFSCFEELNVIYTGIASKSLRSRDYKQHFKGNNAGSSTLRKSLGVLFGYKQIERDLGKNNKKTKFCLIDEIELSEWMCENLVMFFLSTSEFSKLEVDLIKHFNPPLNLKDNKSFINFEFRKLVSNLRTRNNS